MSRSLRIENHPVLASLPPATVPFSFDGRALLARPGEVISSALFAAGISIFGHHHRDGGAQGIFCVNGQCSQCMVLVDGRPLKACMTPVHEGVRVESCNGRPVLPPDDEAGPSGRPGEHRTRVLVLGGGPAGLCAAVELGRLGVEVLVVDDKQELGGKLTLQTHQFFGSVKECWAGVRGIDIARVLAAEVGELPSIQVWLDSTAIGVFADRRVGIVGPYGYRLVEFDALLVALGAREKGLSFPGCDLPGVFGAGAFQTLVNRDLVHAADRLFVLGGGNVGLIGAYHALQAGIDVVGLVEALPQVGGYKVHADKLRRLGVPIWTSHTVARADADGKGEKLASVTIAAVDAGFRPVPGTERTFGVDTLLIAVGLNPCNELLLKARELGVRAYGAGDTAEIAEASAAILSGRIVGREIANDLGIPIAIPPDWPGMAATLRHRPGAVQALELVDRPLAVFPVLRCVQEIPCNPCVDVCPEGLITMDGSILATPRYHGTCLGCGECVSVCPGLAITLVYNDYDLEGEKALLMLPFEFDLERVPLGAEVRTVDMEGNPVGRGCVVAIRSREEQDRRHLLLVEVPAADKFLVAGFTIREPSTPIGALPFDDSADPIVCRCERVRKSDIVREIRRGVRDMNQLKAVVRASMGGCAGKTCTDLVRRLFVEEGIDPAAITPGTMRPLVAEAPLVAFTRGEEI
ncbi:MAG: FAD-dependent oxidoreductase [Planctomycetota bacterium]